MIVNFFRAAGSALAGVLVHEYPAVIFAYAGFFSRLTNIADVTVGIIACSAGACLSWLAGRAMLNLLARI